VNKIFTSSTYNGVKYGVVTSAGPINNYITMIRESDGDIKAETNNNETNYIIADNYTCTQPATYRYNILIKTTTNTDDLGNITPNPTCEIKEV
jgi:hypothetical protein